MGNEIIHVVKCENSECNQVIRGLRTSPKKATLFMGGADCFRFGDTKIGEISLDQEGKPLTERTEITFTPAVCKSSFVESDKCALEGLKKDAQVSS